MVVLPDGNGADEVSQSTLVALIASRKTADRTRAVDEFARQGGPDAVARISACLRSDPNENLRAHCAELLGSLGPPALPALTEVVGRKDYPRSVRVNAVQALGLLGPPAVAALSKAARDDPEDSVRKAAVQALTRCSGAEATTGLLDALKATKTRWLRAFIVHALGQTADPAALSAVKALVYSTDVTLAKAAIGAVARIDRPSLAPLAADLFDPEVDVKARRRLAAELSDGVSAREIAALTRALVNDQDEGVQAAAAAGMSRLEDVSAKLNAILSEITLRHRGRTELPYASIVKAARFPADASGADRLTEELLSRATKASPPLTGILADILVANSEGDPDSAGRAIDAYETVHQIDALVFQPLRIEVGGTLTLDPILTMIREDLRRNFQEPIQKLNLQTTDMWTNTIKSARTAFTIRTAMSICVFVIGVALIATSIALFVSGKLTTAQAVGSGTAFTGGLVATLLTVYSGPLKDIRQSVSDLGAANVAFIGFVHQVLQVSHTFTAHYLRGTVSFDEAQQAAEIIAVASKTATAALAATGSSITNDQSSGQ
jgi:HEAT repeat protein